jgi:Arc/MetJ family transcription regulator
MSKPKVTPAPPGPQEEQAPRTVPLSEITITWPPLRDFEGEPEKPITVSGKQLAQLVAWLARTAPGRLQPYMANRVWQPDAVNLTLDGMAGLIQAFGEASQEVDDKRPAVCALLAELTRDLAARLAADRDVESDFKNATVTIGAPAGKDA